MSDPRQPPPIRGRALGLAFLCALLPAVIIGAIETILVLPAFAPSRLELVYGAWVHLIFALAAVGVARMLFWRALPRVYVPAALGMFVLIELSFTASFWFLKSPLAPPLASPYGKLFAAVTVLVAFAVSVAIMWMLVRLSHRVRWRVWCAGWRGSLGIALVLIFVVCNLFLVVKHYASSRGGAHAVQSANPAPNASPDVFIVLVDALRYDHVSYNGYKRPTSPTVDALMKESYAFRNAYTPSNKTVPSIVSYFTGLYPTSHRVIGPFQGFPAKAPTVAEQFRAYGYQTAAFVGNSLVSVQRGFGRGFETFSPRGMPWWCYHGRTGLEAFLNYLIVPHDASLGARINRELFAWLDSHPASRGPRFVYLHYMEPHSFYEPPQEHYDAVAAGVPPGPKEPPMFEEYASGDGLVDWESLANGPVVVSDTDRRGTIACYDGEIHLADWYVGEVLKRLRAAGVYDDAHIIFLADHGEEFGDHGGWFHGHSIYDELTRCPLAYRPPGGVGGAIGGAAAGSVVERPIGVLDFFLTLFELLEMDPPPLYQGELVPELFEEGRTAGARKPVVSELPPQLYSMRFGPWKLIRRGDPAKPVDRLFDLTNDPREQNDLALALPDTLDMLRGLLEDALAEHARLSLGDIESTVDPETLERLRSLGYVK